MMGDEAAKWFLRHHFRNHGLTVLRYFLKRGFIETLVKAYNICVTMVAQGHRHQLSIPLLSGNISKRDMAKTFLSFCFPFSKYEVNRENLKFNDAWLC